MSGRVFLAGAGPGDPQLITVGVRELIEQADVILYDRLIPTTALDRARPDALLIFVGKEGGGESVPQQRTEDLMIEHAKAGRSVLRLKGGDPFVFGRGGEEALALRGQGIPYEVLPGVTSGVAACAYAGIPVTHRGLASAVALVTGSSEKQAAPDWPALAVFPGTLVFYMGLSALPEITSGLIAAGRPADEPAAVIERGTMGGERVVRGLLSEIAGAAAAAKLAAPAITVVGAVAALSEELSWRSQDPLSGLSVVVTRARAQASGLTQRLQRLGAEVVQAPAIRIVPLEGPPLDPSPYDLICLTSANGVELLFDRLESGGRDSRSLAGIRIAAIGPGTAEALRARGITADVVPERFVAESLADALSELPVRRALIARATQARDVLPRALRSQGAEVDVLELYETIAEPLPTHTLSAAFGADYITFTSSSTVRLFLLSAGNTSAAGKAAPISPSTRIVSIGPVTSATLREHGLEPDIEAKRHDIEGLVQALSADALSRRT